MKKIFTLIATVMLFAGLQAQTTLTNAVDFTVTDLNGTTHNLFNILNSGKYVCIDFFFTTCGPCQATVPYYAQTYHNYGCNTADIFFISIDLGNTNAQCAQYETTYVGAGNGGFPIVSGLEGGGDAVCSAYGIGAFPTYILIAPNQAVVEQDMWPIANAGTFDTYFTSHQLAQSPCATGITENPVNETSVVELFPNPASSDLTIRSEQSIESYTIYDASGRVVRSEQLSATSSTVQITVSDLAPGMYVAEVRTSEGLARKRFNRQ